MHGGYRPDLIRVRQGVPVELVFHRQEKPRLHAKAGTGEAIRALLGSRARTARVIRDGTEQEIPVEDIAVGDDVLVRPR